MKQMLAAMSLMTAAIAIVTPASAQADCTNYGVQNQVTVIGNNDYHCTYQYCATGGAGAGSAGVGAGTAGGSGTAGASATAGTGCTNDATQGEPSKPPCNPLSGWTSSASKTEIPICA